MKELKNYVKDCLFNKVLQKLSLLSILISIGTPALAQSPSCEKSLIANYPKDVWQLPSAPEAMFFKAGLSVDADGAPNAYHPNNIGIDYLANAGKPGNWWGIVTDTGKADGTPIVQKSNDPFPGYYVSQTSLTDPSKLRTDPAAYVDSREIPYVALPKKFKLDQTVQALGIRKGDLAVIFNGKNNKISYGIFADVGPKGSLGEGSIALARNLGIKDNPKNGGTAADVVYVIFPKSGNGRPQTITEIQSKGEQLFASWMSRFPSGVPSPLFSCFQEYFPTTKSLAIPAKFGWLDTGITLSKGSYLSIRATGTWSNGGETVQFVSPVGFDNHRFSGALLESANFASLIAKVGSRVFYVGDRYDGNVSESGQLYLSMNDTPNTLDDNQGQLQVTIIPPK